MYRAALLVNWSWSTSICDALWGGLGAREKPFSVRVLSLFNYFWFKHHYEHSYQRRRLKILYNYDKSYTSIVYIFHFVFIFHNVFIFHFVYIFHYVFLFHFPLHILTWFQIPVTILISWRSIFFLSFLILALTSFLCKSRTASQISRIQRREQGPSGESHKPQARSKTPDTPLTNPKNCRGGGGGYFLGQGTLEARVHTSISFWTERVQKKNLTKIGMIFS